MLGFSHAENVFTTRDCCRWHAGSARDGNTTSVTKSGAHECSWRHWRLALWLSNLHCILLLGFCPLGLPVRVRSCGTGLVWLTMELGCRDCTQTQQLRAEAQPECPCGAFVEMRCYTGLLFSQGSCRWFLVYSWQTSLECANKTRRACKLHFLVCAAVIVIPVTVLVPRYCYSQLWWL